MNCKKLLPLILLPFIFSCNKSESASSADTATLKREINEEPQQETTQPSPIPVTINNTAYPADSAQATPEVTRESVDWDKKIIKTATLKFEVKNHKTYAANIYRTVKQSGGYIASEDQNTSEEKMESILTIKVPVAQFEDLMSKLPGEDVKLIERKITTDDVTGDVVDVKARLAAKEQMRQKYSDFFKQAKNMEEVLKVQSELNTLQEEMESAAGRVNYLTHASAMSTIQLTFYQPLDGFTPGNSSPSFITRIVEAFATGGKTLADILVGFVSLWPMIAIIALVIFFARRYSTPKIKQPNP